MRRRWAREVRCLPCKGSATLKCSPKYPSAVLPNATRTPSTGPWLVVERLPAYAPDLNPVEGLSSSLKAVELANLTMPTLAEAIDQAYQGIDRIRRTSHLAYSFLRHAGLSVS